MTFAYVGDALDEIEEQPAAFGAITNQTMSQICLAAKGSYSAHSALATKGIKVEPIPGAPEEFLVRWSGVLHVSA